MRRIGPYLLLVLCITLLVTLVQGSFAKLPAAHDLPEGPPLLTGMSWNVDHGEYGVPAQLDFVLSQTHQPDLLYFEEVSRHLMTRYVKGIQDRTGRRWTYLYVEHCDIDGSIRESCHRRKDEGILFLTTRPVLATGSTLLWARDRWSDARAAGYMKLDIGGEPVQVFGSHFAAGTGMNSEGADLDALRTRQAVGLREWAAQFGDGPRVIVGDLNARPGERPYQEIAKQYADSWALLRPDDPGLTFSADPGNAPLEKRIDYWFAERGSRVQAVAIERPEFPAGPLSDHYALTVTYLLGPRRVGAEP